MYELLPIIGHMPLNLQYFSDLFPQGYFNTFNCESLEDICAQVTKLKKQSYNSRQPAKRSLENNAQKKKKKIERKEDFYLNQYFIKTAFANIFKCIKCKLHLSENQTTKILKSEYQNYNLDLMDRRFGEFFICIYCNQGNTRNQQPPPDELNIISTVNNDNVIFTIVHSEAGDNNLERNPNEVIDHAYVAEEEVIGALEDDNDNMNPDLMLDYLIENIPDNFQEFGAEEVDDMNVSLNNREGSLQMNDPNELSTREYPGGESSRQPSSSEDQVLSNLDVEGQVMSFRGNNRQENKIAFNYKIIF